MQQEQDYNRLVEGDRFALRANEAVIRSGVRETFTPHAPIDEIDMLLDRQNEVDGLLQLLSTPGLHGIVFGPRGVGKSSLAGSVQKYFLRVLHPGREFIYSCDRESTFSAMMAEPLLALCSYDVGVSESEFEAGVTGEVSAGLPGAGAKGGASASSTVKRAQETVTPSKAAALLADKSGVLIIDEVDTLSSVDDRRRLAELAKLLSDRRSHFKLIIVGISHTASELVAQHPSAGRCLKEIRLDTMTSLGLREILRIGAAKHGFSFAPDVETTIVNASCGYPYFTHLLALKCAENLVRDNPAQFRMTRQARSPVTLRITKDHLAHALRAAASEAEGRLSDQYDRAVLSRRSNRFEAAVAAAARIDEPQFHRKRWRTELAKDMGGDEVVAERILKAVVTSLVHSENSLNERSLLVRKSHGVFAFDDPRMRSFVRIQNELSIA